MALYLTATMSYRWPLGRISRRLYREPGEQLVIGLAAAPVRPLAAYALVSVGYSDLRARSGLTTEQLIYRGRAEGWLVVSSLEPPS